MKTLIVEDDLISRIFLQTFLSRFGECHIAVNGKEAIEAFRTAAYHGVPYDLICLDIMMPEMDGNEALKQIRSLEKERHSISTVKIIMTTAVTDVKEVLHSLEESCDAYLYKPIETDTLLKELKALQLVE